MLMTGVLFMQMTGSDIQKLRLELGMTVAQLAQLLGVHYVTVLRWEQVGNQALRLDPLYASFLAQIQRGLETRKAQERAEWGEAMLRGLLLGGTLMGLAVLLKGLVPDENPPQPRRTKSKRRKGSSR